MLVDAAWHIGKRPGQRSVQSARIARSFALFPPIGRPMNSNSILAQTGLTGTFLPIKLDKQNKLEFLN